MALAGAADVRHLEEWKRFYSNNDEDKSCEYFWSKFDPECYSIWRGDYRYNNELPHQLTPDQYYKLDWALEKDRQDLGNRNDNYRDVARQENTCN